MGRILPVIAATAGHVDHGKTALVEALTGCNTDRLLQEKERGLSIDIGFASCQLDKDNDIGIADLPGHEDYIRNMAAGAVSARIVLLTVAADESVMPQTREHLEVVSELADCRILLVITKVDLVDTECRDIVREEALGLLKEYGLTAAGVYYTSVRTFEGIMSLREGLLQAAAELGTVDDRRDFRVFIERTFHAKGHGIVVTGVPVSGGVALGDNLELDGEEVRVRGLESFGRRVDQAGSGGCLAINIDYIGSATGKKPVERGAVLCAQSYSSAADYIVRIHRISSDYKFKRMVKCRIHAGTFCSNASLKILGQSLSAEMQEGFAHLKLERPSVLAAGDRFLLRMSRPLGNIAGGVILSAEGAYRLSNRDTFRMELFAAAEAAVQRRDYLTGELLAGNRYVVSRADIARLGHFDEDVVQSEVSRMVEAGELLLICRDYWLLAAKQKILSFSFQSALRQYHEENPYRCGMEYDMVARVLGIPVDGVQRLLKIFTGYTDLNVKDGLVACGDFQPKLAGRALELYRVIEQSITGEPGFWLALGELRDRCGVAQKEAQEVIRIFLNAGSAVIIAGKYLVAGAEIERLRGLLLEEFSNAEVLQIPRWREVCGLSRNYAVASLEYFDMLKLTRRVESGRVIADNKMI